MFWVFFLVRVVFVYRLDSVKTYLYKLISSSIHVYQRQHTVCSSSHRWICSINTMTSLRGPFESEIQAISVFELKRNERTGKKRLLRNQIDEQAIFTLFVVRLLFYRIKKHELHPMWITWCECLRPNRSFRSFSVHITKQTRNIKLPKFLGSENGNKEAMVYLLRDSLWWIWSPTLQWSDDCTQ